ncbi:MAG: 4-hydroxy-tetrahydrodipicolinate synthase [Alphaproteobacteria bacterium GM202ARS2]|nr:4-hydroxy-tetrahydrodipicolinate synthase [Alphaproteobacteria bacterium GM202ARS2]
MLFRGSITALITPFSGADVDEDSFCRLVRWQIEQGTHGFVPCGTTGESPTLSHDEHNRVVALCIEEAQGRVPVMAGCGSNSTKEAIELARHAQAAGANGILVVAPYYNKPNQEGLYQHFKAVAAATTLPLFVYNIPGRSIVDIHDETLVRLFACDTIAGIKDASQDLARPLAMRLAAQEAGRDFCQLSGEDATVVPFLSMGGVGCISVSSNVAPRLCADLHEAWWAGDWKKADTLNQRLYPLHSVLFTEPNPVPVKYAASLLGLCQEDVRNPLVPASKETKQHVKDTIHQLKLQA